MSESSLKPVEIDEMPPEIRTLIAQCEANVSNFNNDQMSAALHFAEECWRKLTAGGEGGEFAPAIRAITTDWPATNERRVDLIDKKVARTLTDAEREELNRLQAYANARQSLFAPLPIEQLESVSPPYGNLSLSEAGKRFREWLREPALGRMSLEKATEINDRIAQQALKIFAECGLKSSPPPPVVIEGKGQARTDDDAKCYWLRESPSGEVEFLEPSKSVFLPGCRYMRCPTFPPRPAFVAPEKPELKQVLVRGKDGGNPYWGVQSHGYLYTLGGRIDETAVEVLDPNSGEVVR